MKRRHLFFTITAAVLLMASIAAAQTTTASLEDIVPRYPGSQMQFQGSGSTHPRVVVTTDDDLDAVVIFFRKKLASRGWELVSGMHLKHGKTLTWVKNGNTLNLSAEQSGSTAEIVFWVE